MPSIHLMNDILTPLVRQEFRRFKYSIGHLLTTGIATSIVVVLFLYIFGDFVREKLPMANPEIAANIRYFSLLGLIIVSAIVFARWLRGLLFDHQSWLTSIQGFGLDSQKIKDKASTAGALIIAVCMVLMCFVLQFFLGPLKLIHWMTAVTASPVTFLFLRQCVIKVPELKESPRASSQCVIEDPLYAWRHSRIMNGSWPGSFLRILAAIPIVLGTTSLAAGQAVELAYICSLLGGIILSWTVSFLVADDLKSTWIERQAAVGHKSWISAWQNIFFGWSLSVAATTFILFMTSGMVASNPSLGILTNWAVLSKIILSGLLGAFLAGFPVWLASAFVLQIDGQKVLTNIIVITLVGLFVGTAVIAVPFMGPGIYFLYREAHRYQEGRFARGSHH